MRLLSQSTRTTIRTLTLLFALTSLLLTMMTPFVGAADATLPGSTFDGSDGENIPHPGSLELSDPCPSGNDGDEVTTGADDGPVNENTTKFGVINRDDPPTIALDQNQPGKSDLCKAWINSEIQGDDLFLYFAWERESTSGSTTVFFEFHQQELACTTVTTENQNSCNPFNPRTDGDFVLTFDFQGNTETIYQRTWNGTNESGSFGDPVNLSEIGFAEASLATGDKSRGEAVVNLADAGILDPTDDVCKAVAGVIPGTVTGNSDQADYKDVILSANQPHISNCGQVIVTKESTTGSFYGDTFEVTLSGDAGTVNRTETLTETEPTFTANDVFASDDYAVSEVVPDGWTIQSISCDDETSEATGEGVTELTGITVEADETVTCTVTNAPDLPTIEIVKEVTNDDGGTATASKFIATIDDAGQAWDDTTESTDGLTISTGPIPADPTIGDQTYTVGETIPTELAQAYSQTGISCDDGDNVTNGDTTLNVALDLGDSVVCTITNDDEPGNLQIVKHATNDNGGTRLAQDFDVFLNDGADPVTLTSISVDNVTGVSTAGTDPIPVEANTPHTISENVPDGYTLTSIECDNDVETTGSNNLGVEVGNGETVVCTFYNDDLPPGLTVQKSITPEFGGSDDTTPFTLEIFEYDLVTENLGDLVASGDTELVSVPDAGTYFITESGIPDGYELDTIDCLDVTDEENPTSIGEFDEVAGGAIVTVGLGQRVLCTVTNVDLPSTLTIVKQVVNNDGGELNADDFDVWFGDDTNVQTLTPADTLEASVTIDELAGNATHTIGELDPGDGYVLDSLTCEGADEVVELEDGLSAEVTIPFHSEVTCTLVNNDAPATLNLVKEFGDHFGGEATQDDFEPTVEGDESDYDWGDNIVEAGEYTIDEGDAEGSSYLADGQYAIESIDCGDGSDTVQIPNGGSATCTVTNVGVPSTLTIVKQVVNDDGGGLGFNDFGVWFGNESNTQTLQSFQGSDTIGSVEITELDGNTTYTVGEADPGPGYELTSISCEGGETLVSENGLSIDVALGLADEVTCTLVNNDIAPLVTLTKTVTNDDGGTLAADAFPVTFDDQGATWGAQFETTVGDHRAAEEQQPGYTSEGWGGDCAADGSLTTVPGGVYECTITNDDVPAGLTIVKEVVNDDEGELGPEDFPLEVTPEGGETDVVDSGAVTTVPAGTYTIGEQQQDDYELVSIVCDNGVEAAEGEDTVTVTVANGESVICTITNDDVPPVVIVGEILGTVEPICDADAAYLNYEAFTQNVDSETVTIHWFDANGVEQHTDVVEGLSGRVLWPGAEVDDDGFATDWPGFVFDGEVWEEGDDGFAWANGAVTVTLEVNPTTDPLAATYPSDADAAAGEDCLPPEIEVAGQQFEKPAPAPTELPRTGLDTGRMALWAALLAGLGALILLSTSTPTATVRQRR